MAKRRMTVNVFKDSKREWRWNIVSGGHTVADSGEGYVHRTKLFTTLRSIIDDMGAGRLRLLVEDDPNHECHL